MPTFDDPNVERIYQAGLVQIAETKALNRWEDGVLVMPFVCHWCRCRRTTFALMLGDGVPICGECLGFNPAEAFQEKVGV